MNRYVIIILVAAALFLPFLGNVHLFDWDEINFAECAREMIVSDNYLRVQINYLPFWEKPPLFIWFQVLAMKIFGVNEYAARFPNAVIGIITLVTLFYAGKRVVNEKMANWWVLLYAASWLPHFYFKSGIIDPAFNLFIFQAFFQVHLLRAGGRKILHAVLAGLFLGLAVLTKGPVAILVAAISFGVYIIVSRGLNGYKLGHLLLVALAAAATTMIWFGIEILNNGWGLVNDFVTYQVRLFQTEDAGHGGPFFYHFVVLLIGCFPASVFLLQYKKHRENSAARDFTKWMWILFGVVLILFSIVKTKIVHYSSLCYFPLTYLGAMALYNITSNNLKFSKLVKAILLFIGSVWGILLTALPLVGIYKDKLIPLIDDPFAVANLQADVSWTYTECIWGLLYLVGIWVIANLKNTRNALVALSILQLIIIQVTIIHFTPKIEAFSQRAAIEYFKSFAGKDVHVQVLGYKSYAHLFYAKTLPPALPDEQQLLYGEINKPVHFICKIIDADKYKAMPQLKQTGEKNGFVFFTRIK